MSNWAKCSECLPENSVDVVCSDNYGYLYIGYYIKNNYKRYNKRYPRIQWYAHYDESEPRSPPVYWLPLPELPK